LSPYAMASPQEDRIPLAVCLVSVICRAAEQENPLRSGDGGNPSPSGEAKGVGMWSRVRDHVHELVRPACDEGHDCVGIEGQRPPSALSGGLTCEAQAPRSLFLSRARRLWVPGVLMSQMAWSDQREGGESPCATVNSQLTTTKPPSCRRWLFTYIHEQ